MHQTGMERPSGMLKTQEEKFKRWRPVILGGGGLLDDFSLQDSFNLDEVLCMMVVESIGWRSKHFSLFFF
jgi:hypothetical protein